MSKDSFNDNNIDRSKTELTPVCAICGDLLEANISNTNAISPKCNNEFQLILIDKDFEKMRASFSGPCLVCGLELPVDSIILWKRGTGVKHLLCEKSPYPKLKLEDWL